MSLVYLGGLKIFQGLIDEGTKSIEQGIAYAESLEFPFGLAFSHCCAAIFFRNTNNIERVQLHAEAQRKISMEKDFPWLTSHALIYAGWAEQCQNQPGALEKIEMGMSQISAWGSTSFDSVGHHVLAHQDARIRAHQYEEANEKLEYILKTMKSLGCKEALPEVLRLKGVCALGRDNSNVLEAESHFQESLQESRDHKTRLWELRATISLARLWGEGSERNKAYDLLYPFYDSFTEGFEVALLQEAKGLLEQLQ